MWDFLHGYPTEGICHGADQYNSCKDRAEILDHKVENFLPAEGLSILRDFFLHFLQTDYFGDKQADRDSGIITELVRKSKKSRNCMPMMVTPASGP